MYPFRLLNRKDQRGFTFLDALLQLMILVCFAHFFLIFFIWYSHKDDGMFNTDELQWELFSFQLQKELTYTSKFTPRTSYHIQYSSSRGDLGVKHTSGELRREDGYQPLLFGVSTVRFEYNNYLLNTTVKFINGKERSREFIVPNTKE
ncbi:competence type IV pilus minor pilin ComGF [Rummeliibacillus pycnus]|uniref:competence type IV pilus minor pilin ComGF n=1 Tax=Rummeliibacillus pycnus TaxID=101070 RepID=UPI000C9CA1C3|nr:competence type IV pilus minor pilin ComGF [Rummeliibacillus pycnus]